MNAPSELSFEEMLRVRLDVMRREHRELDLAIGAMESAVRPDPLTLRRLKKQKLALKDQIVRLEDRLIPDIIA
ncbi:MAG: YdcH family protein [Paracoccaceae bacterium]